MLSRMVCIAHTQGPQSSLGPTLQDFAVAWKGQAQRNPVCPFAAKMSFVILEPLVEMFINNERENEEEREIFRA